MDNPGYYAIIPANVRYDKNLKANEKLLYGEINALCSEDGCCWATNEYFSNVFNVSEITISRQIKNLEKQKYINIKHIKKDSEVLKRVITIN